MYRHGKAQKPHWLGLWSKGEINAKTAKEQARDLFKNPEKVNVQIGSLLEVANEWYESKVKGKHRRAAETKRILDVNIKASEKWASHPFVKLRRAEWNALAAEVRTKHTPNVADAFLSKGSAICNWFGAVKDENYRNPITRAMWNDSRSYREKARDRTLSDEEIKIVWPVCTGRYGNIFKETLLTAQRREVIGSMRWDDLNFDTRTWTIPKEVACMLKSISLQSPCHDAPTSASNTISRLPEEFPTPWDLTAFRLPV
jgi:integrase